MANACTSFVCCTAVTVPLSSCSRGWRASRDALAVCTRSWRSNANEVTSTSRAHPGQLSAELELKERASVSIVRQPLPARIDVAELFDSGVAPGTHIIPANSPEFHPRNRST